MIKSDPSGLSVFEANYSENKESRLKKIFFFFNSDDLPGQKSDRFALKMGKIQENLISCTIHVLYTILKLISFRFSKTML